MKSRWVVMALAVVVMGMSGCFWPSHGMTGSLKPPHAGKSTKRKNPRALVTDILLLPKQKIVSKQLQRVEFYKGRSRALAFDALIGPYPYRTDDDPNTDGPDAVAYFDHSRAELYLLAGWVIAAGESTVVEAELVEATGVGGSNATIIVWIHPTGDVYLFLLRKTGSERATLSLRSDPSKYKTWNFEAPYEKTERFVVFHPPATFEDPRPIDDIPALREFVTDVMSFASDAEILDADR